MNLPALPFTAAVVTLAATSMLLMGCSSDDPLAGTWRTAEVSLEDAVATISRHGLGEWVEEFRANPPFAGETVLELEVANGEWDLYGESSDGEREPIDYDAEYKVDGDTVTFVHADGSNTYRWAIDGDTLRLDFLRSTLPGYEGVPEEVFQRALYMTAGFTRQG